jgi:hypothetical protein
MFKLSGVDYDEIAGTADNALKAVVIPLVVAAGALIIVTTLLGWWKSTLRVRTEPAVGSWPCRS